MIEEVLNEIAEAEAKAAEIIAAARETAKQISLSTAVESEKIKAEFVAETKRAVAEIKAAAEATAQAEADKISKKATDDAQQLVRSAERNVRAAGEWLAEKIKPNK